MSHEIEDRLRHALASASEPQRITALSRALSDLIQAKTDLSDAKARARAVLDSPGAPSLIQTSQSDLPLGAASMKCHDAMADVLRRAGVPLRPREIADEINRRGLYAMKDGRDLHQSQVSARARNYPDLFERTADRRIALRRKRHPSQRSSE